MLLDGLPLEVRKVVDKNKDSTRDLHVIPKETDLETLKQRYVEEMKIVNDLAYSEVIDINGKEEGLKIFTDHYHKACSSKEDFYRMVRNKMDVLFEDEEWIVYQRKYS